jgi:hypothetical protein
MTEIFVALLGEGTAVWRPVNAVDLGAGVFQIAPGAIRSADEEWEFLPGENVRCERRALSGDAPVLVAVERVLAAI